MVTEPHASVAEAALAAGTPEGLHPRNEPAGHKVNTGVLTSTLHVNNCTHVEEFPQASVAV